MGLRKYLIFRDEFYVFIWIWGKGRKGKVFEYYEYYVYFSFDRKVFRDKLFIEKLRC